jgi:hypothetical protein
VRGVGFAPPRVAQTRHDVASMVTVLGVTEAMCFRIDRRVIEEGQVIVSISGRVAAENLDTLRSVLAEERRIVAIDLKEVLLIDHDAVTILAVAEARGVELRNCPAYVREWITRERAQMNSDPC